MTKLGVNSEKCIEYGSDSQIDKPQHGCPKRAELLDARLTGASLGEN